MARQHEGTPLEFVYDSEAAPTVAAQQCGACLEAWGEPDVCTCLPEEHRAYLEAATPPDVAELIAELADEADLCRNETATDIADLLDRAATALRLSAGGGWRCPDTGHVYSASDLASLMERRDKFIVSKGLWGEFSATLDGLPASPTVEAGHVE